jgi:hypothetical protein
MSINKYDKIKLLLQNWLPGTIVTSQCLLDQGFTHSDLQRYLNSKWIESVGHGAYKKFNDKIEWQGAVYGLGSDIHVGGKSALTLQGLGHYLNIGKPQIDLFSNNHNPLPLWFRSNDWNADIRYFNANFLPQVGIDDFNCGNFTIKISCPERAAFELMYLLEKIYSYDECRQIAENLSFLRTDILQELFEKSSSIKAKRLLLFFGKFLQLNWFEKIDISKIDLGKGYRKFVEDGIYDNEFMINYPKSFKEDEVRF